MIPRTPEPEVMDTAEEAIDYDQMDHGMVNQLFVEDFLKYVSRHDARAERHSGHLVDLGTGTAQIPIQLLRSWPDAGPVSACDLSLQMLLLADRNIAAAGLQNRIQTVFCDVKQMPFRDAAVDVMISNSIVHHLPEPALMIQEVARCLKPGGLLFFRDLLRPGSISELQQLVLQYAGHEKAHARKMFHDSLHAALTIQEVGQLFADAGMRGVRIEQTSDRHWTAWLLPEQAAEPTFPGQHVSSDQNVR